MKHKFLSIGTTLLMGVLFLSCSSDDGNQCPPDFTGDLTAEEEMLVGAWALSAMVATDEFDLTDDGVDNPSTDIYNQYTECQQDAVYTFGAQRTYGYEEGQNAGGCDAQIQIDGTWELVSGTLRLTSSCSIQSTSVEFNGDSTAFTLSQTFNVRDVNGTLSQTSIDFTYSLVP